MRNYTVEESSTTDLIISSYDNAQSLPTSNQTQHTNSHFAVKNNQTTIVAVFDTQKGAEAAVNELRRQGFTKDEINIVTKDQSGNQQSGRYEDDITDGALTGSTLGGIGGLLIGAGALAIPGVGPIIAAGPIAGALSGALAGGIAGGLIDWGIPAEASRRYENSVGKGNVLTIIQTEEGKVSRASSILNQSGANSVETHNEK